MLQNRLSNNIIVIGNGESRSKIDFNKVKYIKIGCNAILRDCVINHLVCVDKRMVNEAIEHNVTCPIYTRQEWINSYTAFANIKQVPKLPYEGNLRMDDPFQWGSGPYAVLLGSLLARNIILIGFDLFSNNNKVNNIYKGTRNYDKVSHHAIDPAYWIYQIAKVMTIYKTHKYFIYQDSNWMIPKSWQLPNVYVDNLEKFKYYN